MPRTDALLPLDLGPSVVQLLIAQRPPFSYVDRLVGFALAPRPTLAAVRHVSINEPALAGHFPTAPVWPGALTLEGMGQVAGCLATLVSMVEWVELPSLLAHLASVERRSRLEHVPLAPGEEELCHRLSAMRAGHLVVAGSAQVRLLRPVFPGRRLDYRVSITRRLEDAWHFTTQAEVDGVLVAEGTLTGTKVPRP